MIPLTIGIVTYNGEKRIRPTIENVLLEIKNKNVEFIISNNASTDATEKIIKEYPSVTYYKNSENIGFDGNVNSVIEKATGKFVWLLSDNDCIEKNSIEKILKIIEKEPELAIIFTYGNQEMLCNKNSFFKNTEFGNTCISTNIINKEKWLSLDMEKYLWSNWIHLHYSIDILEGKLQNKGYITEKLTIINKESGGWTKGNKLFELINQEFLIINNMKNKGYDPSIQIEFFKKNYKMYLSQIPFSKEKGKMTIDFKLLECKEYFDKKLLIIVMFLTPNFIYKIAFKVKRKVVLK